MINTITVHNIKCNGCATSIKDKLSKIDEVSDVNVETATGEVSFNAIDNKSVERVKNTLEKMGYPEDDPNMIQTAKSYVSCMIGRMK